MPVKIDRRTFLSHIPTAIGAAAASVLVRPLTAKEPDQSSSESCWLEVVAPFIVEQPSLGIRSEIILTSDTFNGAKGYTDGGQKTEYELCLYHSDGRVVGSDGVAKRLVVPAMSPAVIPVREIIGEAKSFFGGLKVRLRPQGAGPMHASDLFSSAFVRWATDSSFDNVHANPDPIQWQIKESFFYSMPFPPLGDYECFYCLFNPYDQASFGEVSIYDNFGKRHRAMRYELKPRSSLLLDLRKCEFLSDIARAFAGRSADVPLSLAAGGTVAVTNAPNSVKNFGYMLIRQPQKPRFSIEHPIHQSVYKPAAGTEPFDATGRFKAKNILFTPLVFRSKRIGGLTLNSRFHLSSGAPIEDNLWCSPFVTDANGEVQWQFSSGVRAPEMIPAKQVKRNAIRLGGQQSCTIDCSQIEVLEDFSGGLSLAIAPLSNHTLMKAEVTISEWGAHAFTHFRPGLNAARAYQSPAERGGLVTDYITTGASLERNEAELVKDEIICIVNIDGSGQAGTPEIEVFGANGLVARLGPLQIPGFACRHFLLSDLMPNGRGLAGLTLRLVDEKTVLLMSLIHLDYVRRDLALDHGSDRFSTYLDFNCKVDK